MSKPIERVRIGWTENVDLPDWNVSRLRAKIDTGARSSALHVENIEELPRYLIRFDGVLHRKVPNLAIHGPTKIHRRTQVRTSTAMREKR